MRNNAKLKKRKSNKNLLLSRLKLPLLQRVNQVLLPRPQLQLLSRIADSSFSLLLETENTKRKRKKRRRGLIAKTRKKKNGTSTSWIRFLTSLPIRMEALVLWWQLWSTKSTKLTRNPMLKLAQLRSSSS